GIRDFHVTGVQTCALPISYRALIDLAPQSEEAYWAREKLAEIAHRHLKDYPEAISHWQALAGSGRPDADRFAYLVAKAYFELRRSEERRVGKEWRERGTRP